MPVQQVDNQGVIDVLLKKQYLTQEQFNKVKLESVNTGTLPEILVEKHNFVTQEQLSEAKAEVYNNPMVRI